MKIYKTLVQFLEGGETTKVDTIEYEGKLWLVPEWLDMPIERVTMPTRIIQLDLLDYKASDLDGVDFVLSDPLSKDLLYGRTQTQEGLEVVVLNHPEISFQTGVLH